MDNDAAEWTSFIQVHYPAIAEVALSPDGRHVVYTVREPFMSLTESRFLTHLYLAAVPADGESAEPVQLTCGRHSNHHARWSPDGAYLAFLSDRGPGGRPNVYVMRVAGGEPWALTEYEETGVTDLAWSPDGETLAFLMPEPPTEEKRKARTARDDMILWDEDFDFQHVFTVPFVVAPRDLPEVEQLTRGRFHVLRLAWMPEGDRLALVHRPTPEEDTWTETALSLVRAWVGPGDEPFGFDDLTELGKVRAWSPEPVPSPDGAWIACLTGDLPLRWAESSRVVLYAADPDAEGEREVRPLVATPDGQCWTIGWSADGTQVYVGEMAGIDTHLWALDASGETATPVLASPTYKAALHTRGNDRIAFVEETFWRANGVWLWSADAEAGVRFVTAPEMPVGWPDADMPEVEVLQWEAPDPLPGETERPVIEGMVTYPPGTKRGEPVPLVVDVHGGPAGAFQRRYLGIPDKYCDVLALAEAGIAVLRVNPRGSSGYGRDFRFANRGDWGGGDFRDIMAGVDLLVARGDVDPERLGIMGWSYGGYMTSWAITQTDRFGAACVGAGVTNLMSFNGTADIPGFVPDYFDGEFWDNLGAYRDHSALFQVGAVSTPTLIQHGQADVRVPLSQGRELYNALKRRGIATKMVIYPRQGHGFTEPRLVIDRRRRPVGWFVAWLTVSG